MPRFWLSAQRRSEPARRGDSHVKRSNGFTRTTREPDPAEELTAKRMGYPSAFHTLSARETGSTSRAVSTSMTDHPPAKGSKVSALQSSAGC